MRKAKHNAIKKKPAGSQEVWWRCKKNDHSRFDNALDLYCALKKSNSARSYRSLGREWIAFCHLNTVDSAAPTERDAIRFAEYLLKERKNTRATALRTMHVLAAIYRPSNVAVFAAPIARLRGARVGEVRPTKALDREDVIRLLNAPWPGTLDGLNDRALLALLFGGGLRVSEALGIRLCDVRQKDFGVTILLRSTKAGRDQEQVFPRWASDRIVAQLRAREKETPDLSEPLIVQRRAGAITQCNACTIRRKFKRLLSAAGLATDASTHSGRATAATRLLEKGYDYREVKDFLRHSSMKMVEIYDKRNIAGENSAALDLDYESPQKNLDEQKKKFKFR